MKQIKKLWVLLISLAVLGGDQLLKHWVTENVPMHGAHPVIPGFFHLTLLHNTGAAYSILQGMRWPLIVVACVCVVCILVYLLRGKGTVLSRAGMAMVLGGALGNLLDRIRFGYVVDMFEVEFVEYPVFNVADMCIVVGGVIFCFLFLFFPEGKRKRPAPTHVQEKQSDDT